MFKRISIFPALFLVATAALIAGCGGGDETVTKAEFVKEAEAICKKASKDEEQKHGEYVQENYERMKQEPPPPGNTRTVSDVVRQIRVPNILKELEDLEGLEWPEADKKLLEEIFAGTRDGLEELRKDPQLLWASKAGNPLYPSYKLASDYGFKWCAEA